MPAVPGSAWFVPYSLLATRYSLFRSGAQFARAPLDMVTPSCPVLVVFDDDQFRRELIRKLDENHFSVTYVPDGDEAVRALGDHSNFRVIIVGLDLKGGKGTRTVSHLRDHREVIKCGVLIVGEPDPALRTYAPWADETLLKPVDPAYVMTRARTYCNC